MLLDEVDIKEGVTNAFQIEGLETVYRRDDLGMFELRRFRVSRVLFEEEVYATLSSLCRGKTLSQMTVVMICSQSWAYCPL